ncbi:MAG: hypothetical protein IJ290_00835 [Bacteroidaceae bacterium]|nr:hypothetical protein [Bacteroidaceae bacterium]MBQ7966445.1 hypothetical protein [Bacteroidaceae bacterium]
MASRFALAGGLAADAEEASVLGQAKRKHYDEGNFSFPEECSLLHISAGW